MAEINKSLLDIESDTKPIARIEEIKIIEDLDLSDNPKQYHTRNVFLLSFYLAGMRVADILQMTWANMQGERIYYTMNKNQKNLSLKIHDKLQKILSEYLPTKTSHTNNIQIIKIDHPNHIIFSMMPILFAILRVVIPNIK